ncbi:MAG: hypothetical protein FJZ13_00750 [Candidatus Omnitrophica bacterium]|nr:hypothetical protein [Candidatus Omnitrophota bacterium]
MTEQTYLSWVKSVFRKSHKAPAVFLAAINSVLRARHPKAAMKYHLESSFNSRDGFSLIKAIQVFRYASGTRGICIGNLFDPDKLLDGVRKINRLFRADFNTGMMRDLCGLPLSKNRKNDVVVFTLDFNRPLHRFRKLSLHINPEHPQDIIRLKDRMKIKQSEAIRGNLDNLEFVGIDFYPQGECSLKTYQRIDSLPRGMDKGRKETMSQLGKLIRPRAMLLMTRFDNHGGHSAQNVYFYPGGRGGRQLLGLPPLSGYSDFLKKIGPYLESFQIIWIAVKDSILELYFS